ncbi:MAG: TonB-dependent receptor domain-containing protein, partial [bacterium]
MKKYIELVYAVCLLTANLPAGFASDDDDAIHFGEISGKITNAETGAPLADVNISVVNSTFGAASSAHGFYLINNVPAGVYRLLISRIGYETEFQDNVLVKPGKIAVRDVKLTPAIVQLNEVIMSASRREQTARMTPASVSVVSSSDIEHRNVSTFDQALDDVPGISIQRTIGVSVQSLSIRGSSDVAGGGVGNRVFLAIDGRPALSSDSGGALWSLVPTNFIDRIEVVKGAFSSLYGSTAMGGVINVITKKPYARGYLKVKVNSGFYESPPKSLQYNDGVSFFNSVELNHSNSFGKFSYLLSLSRKESDGHRQRSAYEFYNLYGKLFFDLSNNRNLEVTIGGDVGRNDYPHTWFSRLRPLNVAPKNTDNEQRKRTFSTDVYYYAVPNPRVKYSSRFFFYRQLFKSVFNPDDPLRSIPGNEPFGQFIRSDSRKIGNISQLDYYLSDENYLSVGADIQRDIVDSVPDTILYGNRRVNNFAAYFQDEHEISDKLTVNVGARYDLNKLEGGKLLTQFSPKVALNFSPVESWSLRFLAGRAFRAPSIAERFFQEEIAGGTRFKPNPDLRAEKVTSLELGSRFGLGSKADLDVALFHNT